MAKTVEIEIRWRYKNSNYFAQEVGKIKVSDGDIFEIQKQAEKMIEQKAYSLSKNIAIESQSFQDD